MSFQPKENKIVTDVLIIGGGMSGVFAAIKAKEDGTSVTIVDRGYIGRAGASSFNDGHYTVFNPNWGHKLEVWKRYNAEVGEYMNNPQWTEATVLESWDRFQDMLSYGVKPLRDENGEYLRLFGGQGREAGGVEAVALGWGPGTMPILRKHVLKLGVEIVDHIMITDLLKEGDCVCGAVGFQTQHGDFYIFNAKATIICTGTSGYKGQAPAAFSRTSFDGEAMAYRAGASISGKEFSVMGRWTPYVGDLPEENRISIKDAEVDDVYFRHAPWLFGTPCPAMLVGTHIDSEGYNTGSFYPYAPVTIHEGRGPILNDMRNIPEPMKKLAAELYPDCDKRFAQVGAKPMKPGIYSGVFTMHELFLGRSMGGSGGITSTDLYGGTTLKGLFGAGDSYHSAASGAVYPSGGTGLRVAATTGARAGHGAVKFALQRNTPDIDQKQISRLKIDSYNPIDRSGGFDPDWVNEQIRSILMPYYIMCVRKEDRLRATLTLVEFLDNHIVPMMHARDPHGLTHAHEAKNRVFNARMMLESAIFRTESRGLHYREDYPRRDDENWFVHVEIRDKDGKITLSKMPIHKWWPDDIRSIPYDERYPRRYKGE